MKIEIEFDLTLDESIALQKCLLLHVESMVEQTISFAYGLTSQIDKFPLTLDMMDKEDGKVYKRTATVEEFIEAMYKASIVCNGLPAIRDGFFRIMAKQWESMDLDALDYDAIMQQLLLGKVIYG